MIPFRIMYPHIGVLVALFRILHICGKKACSSPDCEADCTLTYATDICIQLVVVGLLSYEMAHGLLLRPCHNLRFCTA